MAYGKEDEIAVMMDRGKFQCWHAWDLDMGRVEYWRGCESNGGCLRYFEGEDVRSIAHYETPGAALKAAIKIGAVVPGLASLGGNVAPLF